MDSKEKNYQVLARQFRPQTFADVMGQEAIITTLKHALAKKRVAQAYLFSGCRGTGKTTLARLLAKALNCKNPTAEHEPCNACLSCREIAGSHSLDVLEIDGASHRGIEDIRLINEAVHFAPTSGNFKIYLLDEVHMLTKEAFNALLKTLEEPPAHVKFFFCTTEAHKIPATILSRCQRFQLNRLSNEQIVNNLLKITSALSIEVNEPAALELVARLAEGSLRDAQSLFDQVVAFSEGVITQESVRGVLGFPSQDLFRRLDCAKGKYEVAFEIVQELYASGKNPLYFLEELAYHFRDHLLKQRGVIAGKSEGYRESQLLDIMEQLQEAMIKIKSAPSERVYLEMVLLNVLRSHERFSPLELTQRLEALEKRLLSARSGETPKPLAPAKPLDKEPAPLPKVPPSEPAKISTTERGKMDTLMRFAAKELNGTLKTE